MATTVVSGRVDADIKREVDRIIERAGKTPGDVIRDVWVTIYRTGEVPTTQEQEEEFREKRRRFQEFMEFVHSAPPAPEWLVNLTDSEMNEMIAEDQMRKWGYV